MTWSTGKSRTGTAWWKATTRRILQRDEHQCTWITGGLRCTNRATDVDHIVNEAAGGGDEDDNLTSLCPFHHRRKTAAEGVRARLERAPKRREPERHPGRIT